MSYGDLIEQMSDAGAPMEAILIAVRALEAKDKADKERRAGQAERTRRSRAMKRDRNVTVTAQSHDAPSLPSHPDKEKSPTPPKEINPTHPTRPAARRERFADPAISLQSILDGMTARRFADHCAQKRRPLSAETANAIVGELRKWRDMGGNPFEAAETAIRKGWVTVEVDWLVNAGLKCTKPQAKVDWADRLRSFYENDVWPHSWGPKPGEPGCDAPPELIREMAA